MDATYGIGFPERDKKPRRKMLRCDAGQGMALHGLAMRCSARLGGARQCLAMRGPARRGKARQGTREVG